MSVQRSVEDGARPLRRSSVYGRSIAWAAMAMVGLATALAPASAGAALLESYASVSLNAGPFFEQYQANATSAVAVTETRSDATATADAAASASWGVLKVGGSVTDFGPGGQSYTGSTAIAKWVDGVVLQSPGLGFGTLVTVKAGISIRGELTASKAISLNDPNNSALSAAGSSSTFEFRSNNGCAFCGVFFSQQQKKDVPPAPYAPVDTGDMFHDFDVSIVMMVGDWLGLQAMLSGGAAATGVFGGTAQASYALDKSVYWTGISEVLGPDGRPLANWSLSSDSGFDWRRDMRPVVGAPVPEPATLGLLAFAVAGATLARRRAV